MRYNENFLKRVREQYPPGTRSVIRLLILSTRN